MSLCPGVLAFFRFSTSISSSILLGALAICFAHWRRRNHDMLIWFVRNLNENERKRARKIKACTELCDLRLRDLARECTSNKWNVEREARLDELVVRAMRGMCARLPGKVAGKVQTAEVIVGLPVALNSCPFGHKCCRVYFMRVLKYFCVRYSFSSLFIFFI